jgi:hypothetical protein
MTLQTTHGFYHRPTFDPRADYVAIRKMKWGNEEVGYVEVPADLNAPLDRKALRPPCDDLLAAKLYRTGFIAMVLDEGGAPRTQDESAAPHPAPEAPPAESQLDASSDAPSEPTGLAIKSHGFGRFSVVDGAGNRVVPADGWLTKEQATAYVSDN